jgi:hypothetical protein
MDELTDAERMLVLQALYNLNLAQSQFQADSGGTNDEMLAMMFVGDVIRSAVAKLGGDPDAPMFGALRQ